ncbi:hypothetical protein RIR_jg42642.t1 [Rhizophagus irregularis DAOM 181602=DAOM 197198]|nr:hypothetical protein RIR_jg42642.t1 [Rhizophagus irregularis DAOM 181602=DAOM 197198]
MVAGRQYKKSQSPILSTTPMESSRLVLHIVLRIWKMHKHVLPRDEFEQLLLINNWSYFVKDRHYPEVLPKSKDLVNKVRNR